MKAVARPRVRILPPQMAWALVQVEETKEVSPRTSCRRPMKLPRKKVNIVTALLVVWNGHSMSGSLLRACVVPDAEQTCVSADFLDTLKRRDRPLASPLPPWKVGLVVGRSQPNREPQNSHK